MDTIVIGVFSPVLVGKGVVVSLAAVVGRGVAVGTLVLVVGPPVVVVDPSCRSAS